jgi:hypothetical protein
MDQNDNIQSEGIRILMSTTGIQWHHRVAGNRYCLVGLQIGEVHSNYWKLVFRKSWLAYARRHGYDLMIVEDFIDRTAGADEAAIKFQKLLLPSLGELRKYDKLVYLDSDMLLTGHAPCVASEVSKGKVGMVSQVTIPFREWFHYIQPIRGGEPTVEAYYQTHLLEEEERSMATGVDDVFNGGLMVCEPGHAEAFRELYEEKKHTLSRRKGHVDQPLVSCRLSELGLIEALDFRFNVIFSMWFALHYRFIRDDDEQAMRSALECTLPLVYFLHFPAMRGVKYLPAPYFDTGS